MSDYPCGANRLKDEPVDYNGWHEWAERKMRTHRQHKCPTCQLFHIWKRKPRPTRSHDAQTHHSPAR
jgi:hypothetical protein